MFFGTIVVKLKVKIELTCFILHLQPQLMFYLNNSRQ